MEHPDLVHALRFRDHLTAHKHGISNQVLNWTSCSYGDGRYVGRFNEFMVDGGPTAKELIPKLDLAKKHISSQLHVGLPDINDFCNYLPEEPQYTVLLSDFLKRVAQCCALLFFWGMKSSITKRQLRNRVPKPKTA
ncbi:hypothetical protein F3Y22_tig00111392pilonHSYRG00023 [Hibiscus syriacus]|uniref:Uncharacterized protein n=1 Tax=Hibiscus syriacus TaxID=106335 RepID=A0A6A2Y6B1_HIBSY|nr:hypothetical protein F3Y22_tig00111392pilonHSYRG00023 [Hibiscus syriacus]